MLAKVVLLLVCLERIRELLQARQLEQLRLGFRGFLLDDDGFLQDGYDVLLSNASGRMVSVLVLADGGPVVYLLV